MGKYRSAYNRDDVDSGWAMTQRQLIKNYKKDIKPPKKRVAKGSVRKSTADVSLSVNDNTRGGKIETAADFLKTIETEYLQIQTPEQFDYAKKYGWMVAEALTEPEPNFHIFEE